MIKSLLPPFCLLLALALAITGFSILAFGGPEASVSLHAARAEGDERVSKPMEANLKQRQTKRMVTIVGLFAGSAAMTAVAFASMGESRQ
ncbi:MAG: hypothetical protein AAFX06_09125 [Planctomycetota bacterium]